MQRIINFLAYFFICAAAAAQQYPFVHYTPKDGLVNSRVRKAYQDSKGRMYFLTYGGLSVYDGVRFRNYKTSDGLGSGLVNDIIEVGADSILIATNTGVLNKLVKGKISRLNTENNFCPVINYFYRHENGKIYLSCDQGLFQLENNRIRPLNIYPLTKDSTSLVFLGNITGSGNYLFICTDDLNGHEGLYLYDIWNNRICDSFTGKYVHPLGKNKKNQVWVSTPERIFVIDNIALSLGKIKLQPPPFQPDFNNVDMKDIVLDNNALMFYKGNDFTADKFHHKGNRSMLSARIPDEIISSDIRHLFVDRENSMWFSSNASGVYKLVQSPLQIFDNPIGKKVNPSIYAAHYSPDGIWYSSNKSLLYKIRGSEIREFKVNMQLPPAIFSANGNKVLGNDDLNIYEAVITNTEKKMNFRKIISLPDTTYFTSRRIVDKNNAIIAAVKGGLGIWINKRLAFFLRFPQIDLVEGLVIDKNELLWMITRYSGIKVFRLHPENPFEYLETIYYFNETQIPGSPRCMELDKTGAVWIGTREHGLFKYHAEDNQLKELAHFTTSNGLTDNFVVSLACDSSNNIIAGTQTGLDRIIHYVGEKYEVENLTKTKNYFGYISDVWVGADGWGYARTFSGSLLKIQPGQPSKNSHNPQLLLEEIRVNTTVIAERNSFSYKQNNLSFLVAAPSYIDESQVRYSYLLEGSGNEYWTDTTLANALINLTNLSTGKYKLSVKAFFPSNMYPPAALNFPFEIAPPWWGTWWFKMIVGLFAITALVFSSRIYYTKRLKKQMAVLEKQQAIEKERTRIATDMHDDLGAGLSRIKFLSENMKANKNANEELKKDVEKISEYSEEMAEKMGEIVWALNQKNDTIADLVAFTRRYTQEYLTGHNITCEIDTPLDLPTTFITGEIRQNVFLSVKECLHNIVKHAEASKVYFSIKLNHEIEIRIQDNGKGINWNAIRPFSNGIDNIRKRMNDINGKVVFEIKKGTLVTLSVPC